MKKNHFTIPSIILGCIIVFSAITAFEISQPAKPWNVPEAAKNKKNPIAADATSLATGKSLWSTHCKSCHGAKGLGDGPKAAKLKTEAGDFSKAEVHTQTDGALFYKISEGRDDMPAFKKKISDADDIWAIVNYMRTFKK
jgi:mono/diheme cytochrome c family protein